MQQVISELKRLQNRSRALLITQRVAVLIAGVLAALVSLILFDFALRLPSGFRLVLLLAGLTGLGYSLWLYLRPATRFYPSLTQLALRVERVLPGVAGRLASSVEFAAAGTDQANQLAARSVRETQTRLAGESVGAVINAARTWRDIGIMVVVVAATSALAVADPSSAITGVKRMLLPYSEAQWPARTGVESMTTARVHPRGQALTLRAGVTKGPASQRLDAHYRLQVDGAWQPWQRIVLTHQVGGNVHERLIDTNAEGIDFYFSSDDAQTSVQHIELAPPPAVRRATLTVAPPDYAAAHVAMTQVELGQGVDSRAVTETPSLIGSTMTLRLEMNKPLPAPSETGGRAEWLTSTFGWNGGSSGDSAELPESALPAFAADEANPAVWTLTWRLAGTRSLSLHLVDEHGLTNSEPIAYRIEAIEDRPPDITITAPQSDETVLASAVVPIRGEARDDVALSTISLVAQVQTGGKSPEEALNESPAWNHEQPAQGATATTEAELDLGPLHVAAGDVVLVRGVADDVYANGEPRRAADGSEPDSSPASAARTSHRTYSSARRLRVIGETDFATQLRRQLGAVRQNAIRIEAQQAELQDDVTEGGVPPGSGLDRAQAQIGERIAAQRTSVQDIERLARQNRLDDPQLSNILQQSNDLLDAAGRAANKAAEAIEKQRHSGEAGDAKNAASQQPEGKTPAPSEAAKPTPKPGTSADHQQPANRPSPGASPSNAPGELQKPDGEPAPRAAPKDQEIVDAQHEVREELTDLIKLLDRDEDTWVVKRQLENLLKEQLDLEQATARLGEQTIGRRPEDLQEPQRSALDKIVQRQRDLRDEARKMIENMRHRAKALEQVDPQAAESMRSAADTAEQRQLDADMDNAAQRAQQNQMTSANAAQQSAQSTMERMLTDIENTRRAQARQLIRQLASLVESIQRLISVQENELTALGLAVDAQNFSGLDRSMIRLNQNTQAVAGEARAAGQEARRIARTLDRAADTQGVAVAAFRAQPVNADDARTAEDRSLALLKEAKDLAEKLQQQTQERETQRRREELINAYAKFAEKQIAVREETLPLSAVEQLDRRQLVEARRLGAAQDDIRTGLNELRDTTNEILDSPIFVHVHRSMDEWSSAVTDLLVAGTVNVDATDRQQLIADSIGRLMKALEESTMPPDEFDKDQQGNQGGGQQQGGEPALIPPIAQLKLLHGLQEQVYNLTRQMDSRADLDAAQRRLRLRDIGQQQRELMELGNQMLEALQRNRPAEPTPQIKPGEQEPTPRQPGEPEPE